MLPKKDREVAHATLRLGFLPPAECPHYVCVACSSGSKKRSRGKLTPKSQAGPGDADVDMEAAAASVAENADIDQVQVRHGSLWKSVGKLSCHPGAYRLCRCDGTVIIEW